MTVEDSLHATATELEIERRDENEEQLRKIIVDRIRDLIHTDFQKLVNILYRMDVSETKLKRMLEENPESDAGVIIAELIIERQAQKIRLRNEQSNISKNNTDIPEEDRWWISREMWIVRREFTPLCADAEALAQALGAGGFLIKH